jgi:hypothetical protein
MWPLSDTPYKLVTHLLLRHEQANPVSAQFERRALQYALTA